MSEINYNGQILSITAIAKSEGLTPKALRDNYEKTQDIYEAVKLTKEGQRNIIRVPYNGQILTISAIAKLEGMSANLLRNKYIEIQDIYEAVRLLKEAQVKNLIPYNGEMLSFNAIAKSEGLTPKVLRNNYEKTQDIYEAVKLTKEGPKNVIRVPYKGQTLAISAIAKLEGMSGDLLRNKYIEIQDIYEAVRLLKEAQVKNLIPYNGEMLSFTAIAKLEGVSTTNLIDKYNKTKDIYKAVESAKESKIRREESITQIPYNGQMLAIKAIAKLEGVTPNTLRRKYEQTHDIYEAVKLAKEVYVSREDRNHQVEYNGQILTISAIAKLEEISQPTLNQKYLETHDIYEAIKLTREGSHIKIPYNGQILTITEIAKKEGIRPNTLRSKFEKTQDINKAVMLCKLVRSKFDRRKEVVQTKEFGNLTYYDLSLILGINYSKLEKLIELGNSIDDIINSKDKISRNTTTKESIKLKNGQSLNEYCIENKLNYRCIYWAMKTYGKTLEEAVANYNKNGQATPKKWIYEKYGLLLRHLLLQENIDMYKIVTYMRENYLPLEQAIERYIIRKNAQKEDLDKDWMEELYDVLSDDSLSKEDYNGYLQTFYVDEQEENCIKKSKEQFNNIKRKLLLFELSEVLEEELFSPEEEKRLFEEYNITEDEVDVIFKDLYKRFTDPGVLMGKDQEEVITPEIEQKRDEKISKYKQMVREIKQDNNIVFMMRFMVGPNVGTNEECRNEIHKELAKEEMKKQDISSNN